MCVLFVLVPGESNSQMVSLSDELSQKNEELLRHQEEIAQLLSQIVELQHRVKEVRGQHNKGLSTAKGRELGLGPYL